MTRGVIVLALFLGFCGDEDTDVEPPVVEPTPEEEDDPDPSELCDDYWEANPLTPGRTVAPNGRYLECLAVGAGAWRLEEETVGEDECVYQEMGVERGGEVRLRVRYDTVTGTRQTLEWDGFDSCEGFVMYRLLAHHDFDGDGHEEVVLSRAEGGMEWGDARPMILTFDGESIGDYAPAHEPLQTLFEVRDFDEDGRPDIISYGPHARGSFEVDETGGGFGGGPNTLWHSRSDGTFTRRDAVARRYLTEACGESDPPYIPAYELQCTVECCENFTPDESVANVNCARLRGASVASVRQAIERQLAGPCREADADRSCCDYVRPALLEAAGRTDLSVRIEGSATSTEAR